MPSGTVSSRSEGSADSSRATSPDRAAERALLFSRWRYYLASIPTLLLRIRNWPDVLAVFLGRKPSRPFPIELRGGGKFLVRSAMDIWIVKETCLDRDYERGAVAVQDGWTVLDIGAGAGDFAVSVARRCPHSRVHAYEPFRESFGLLLENAALNGVENVTPFAEAVAGERGELFLYTTTGLEGQHRTSPGARDPDPALRVAAVTLEDALDRTGSPVCDFVKIDCEGGEYDILFRSSEAALARIRHLAMEYHEGVTSYGHRDLVAFLESRGFRTQRRPNPAHANIGFVFAENRRLAV